MVKKGTLCKNCSKQGHIASKCRAPPMCKMCHKYHHTLLHVEADPKTKVIKKVSKDMTYIREPSKQSEEDLLMTRLVELMPPDGSVTQARAFSESAALT